MAGVISNTSVSPDRPVSEEARLNRRSLTMAWWGICSAMFYLVVAASLAATYGAMDAIIGLVLSVVSYGCINAVLSRHAVLSGLSVAQFSKVLFGKVGGFFVPLIFCTTAIYYSVFEGSVMAVALSHYEPGISLSIAFLIVVAYSVLLICGNAMRWLDKLNGILLPLYLIGLAAAVGISVQKFGYPTGWLSTVPAGNHVSNGWWNCFTYLMGVWVLMMYTWDFARYGKVDDVSYHSRFNFGMPFYIITFLVNGLVGIFLAASIPSDEGISEVSVVFALIKLMGFLGLVFIWITQTRINTGNFYLASTNLKSTFGGSALSNLPHLVWAILTGVIVFLLMFFDVFHYILQALSYQALVIVGWVGISLAHLLGKRDDKYLVAGAPFFKAPGVLAWVISTLVGFALHVFGDSTVSTAAAPSAFITAFICYKLSPLLYRNTQAQSNFG